METSPFMDPRFLIGVAALLLTGFIALIGLIVWLVRLESKVGANEKATGKQEVSLERLWDEFEQHKANAEIHFNKRLADEVERRHTENMTRMQTDISEIKTMVKEIKANK